MAYCGSAGVPSQFMSAEDMANDTGSTVHDQAATVNSPNPVTNTPSFTDNLKNVGPKGAIEAGKKGLEMKAMSSAGSAIASGVKALAALL